MKRITGLLLGAVLLSGAAGAANLPQLKQENKEKLDQLIGADFLKKPARPVNVLVFYRCEGFVHGDSIVTGNEAFRLAAAKTGAIKVDFSEDYEALRAENLAKYDVLVMNSTTGLKTKEHPYIAESLTAFTASGKGYVPIHAGVDNFADSPVLADMAGGLFAGHPWGSGGTWSFKLADAKNPVNAAFAAEPNFKLSDEIYQHRAPAFNPAKIHALVLLDFSDPEVAKQNGRVRPDSTFYPVSWLKRYGKGRVFYTSFAHDARAWVDAKRLRHIFDGFLYAAGLLKCDDTPAGLDVETVKAAKSVSEAELVVRELLAHAGDDALVKDTVEKCRALVKDASASAEVKEGVMKALRGFGLKPVDPPLASPSEASPVMQKVAVAVAAIGKNPKAFAKYVADPERQVRLAAVKAADKVPVAELVAAYAKADDSVKAAILGRFAERGAAEGAPIAAKELENENEDLAFAAASALRYIGTSAELDALVKAMKRGGRVQREAEYAVKNIADKKVGLMLFEKAKDDNGLFRHIAARADSSQIDLWTPYVKSDSHEVRKAAWRALSRQLTDKNLAAAAKWLHSDVKPEEVATAVSALKAAAKNAEQEDVDKHLGASWAGSPSTAKCVLAPIMGQHPSPALGKLLVASLADESADARKAVATALGNWKDIAVVDDVMKAYGAEKDAEVKRVQLDAVFRVVSACSPDVRKSALDLFKRADEADRTYVSKFLLRSVGLPGFADIEALFGDAKYGASAKTAYLEMYNELNSGSTADTSRPLTNEKWSAKASRNSNNVKRGFDGNKGTRWDTGSTPKPGDWFALNLGESAFVSEFIIDDDGSRGDVPPAGEVYVSNDGETWNGPVSKFDKSASKDGICTIPVNAAAKWIKIQLTEISNGHFWSIHEIEIKSGISKDDLAKLKSVVESIKK